MGKRRTIVLVTNSKLLKCRQQLHEQTRLPRGKESRAGREEEGADLRRIEVPDSRRMRDGRRGLEKAALIRVVQESGLSLRDSFEPWRR